MAEKDGKRSWVIFKRAAVVTEVLGFEHDETLTIGRAVAGLNAYSKGVSLGLFQPTHRAEKRAAEDAQRNCSSEGFARLAKKARGKGDLAGNSGCRQML